MSSFSGNLPWPAQLLPSPDGLFLATSDASEKQSGTFDLKRNIPVENIRLFFDPPVGDPRRPESYVLAGKIHFPQSDLPVISVLPDTFVTVDPMNALTLKALTFRAGIVELILTGMTNKVLMGPTPDQQRRISPSLARRIYTSEIWPIIPFILSALFVPAVVWIGRGESPPEGQ
jgi:hypothetical protein